MDLEEVKKFLEAHPGKVFGDALLSETETSNFLKNFIDLKAEYQKVENIHALVPDYLKESDAYKV